MNYLVKRSKTNYIPYLIATLFIVALSLFVADKIQSIDYSTFAKIAIILVFFIIYFIFNEITILSLLVPISFVYIRPANYLFYFSVILILFIFIIQRIRHRNFKLQLPYFSLFSIVVFFGIVATYKATLLSEGIHNFFIIVLTPFILVTVIYNSKLTYKGMIKYFQYIVFTATAVGFLGIIIAILNPLDRIGSTWNTAMTINAFYLFNFFVSLGLAFREKRNTQKLLFYFCALIILFGMLFTYTRMALLSVVFGGFLLAVRFKEIRRYASYMLFLMVMFIPSSMMERAGKNIFEDSSVIIRFFAWIHSYKVFIQNPIFGIGFDTWKNTYGNTIAFDWLYAEHPHNAFLKILLELGIFGMLSYFSIIFGILYKYSKIIKNLPDYEFYYTIFIAILAVIFSCLTDVFITKISITVFFWITIAIMSKMISIYNLGEINAWNTSIAKEE
jgi:O-antigen ligase